MVGFYLDGVGFVRKRNHFDQARAPRAMVQGIPRQRFHFAFTRKGSQEGTKRYVAHFVVVIGHGKFVITREQYHRRINAEKFSSFFQNNLPACAKKLILRNKIFL